MGKDKINEIIKAFSDYAESKKLSLIRKYKLDELRVVWTKMHIYHDGTEWYFALDKRIEELKGRRRFWKKIVKEYIFSKKSFFIVVAMIGVSVSVLGIHDRFVSPKVEILGLRPISVFSKKKMIGTEDYYTIHGISAIVHVRNNNRKATIGGLDLIGKIYLNANDWLSYSKVDGTRHIDEYTQEVKDLKPYYLIHWNGWPVNPANAVILEPREEKYISFTFLEPTILSGDSEVGKNYLGVEKSNLVPKQEKLQPQLYDVFVPNIKKKPNFVYPNWLRDEAKNGLVKFYLKTGPISIEILPSQLKEFRRLSEENWNNMPPARLYHQHPY